jgi:hypothetical protein
MFWSKRQFIMSRGQNRPLQLGWDVYYGQNHQFQHCWNVLMSIASVSAWLECDMVKIVSFSMSGMCCCQNHQFQHGWDVWWLTTSVSACLERVVVKNISFSMARMCCGRKHQFQHG